MKNFIEKNPKLTIISGAVIVFFAIMIMFNNCDYNVASDSIVMPISTDSLKKDSLERVQADSIDRKEEYHGISQD